ncbi:MAG: group II intron reverse transcriptase/maturase [Actinobacteria bacterium]|nr:group II intron reverse transcriptase/maturase [Actinomycetota bacterium]
MPSGDNTAKQDRVRELQVKLYLAAKRSPNRRFHALWDRIHRRDVLERAWQQVRENRGAAGVDRITIAQIEAGGVEAFLDGLEAELKEQRYRPGPARRVYIPKPGRSERRPLGIPSIKDRVCQTAAKLVLEPIFEADFRGCSFGFRPQRSAHQALDQIKREVMRGQRWVIDADIRGFFDALDPEILDQLVCERVSDRRVLKLLRSWLRAGVLEGETLMRPAVGSPQGSPVSPLLANVYLNALDRAWEDGHGGLGVLVRYADDLVVLCRTRAQAEAALSQLRALLAELGLELADAKTCLVCLDNDGEGSFDFLGFHHQMVESFSKPGRHFLARWPSAAATQAARQRIRELTDRRLLRLPVEDVVANLNRFLTGWGGYFRRGNSTTQFHKLDRYTVERLGRFVGQRHGFKRPLAHGRWLVRQQGYLGLRPLVGRVHHGAAHAAR